jgi:hypothetical protein
MGRSGARMWLESSTATPKTAPSAAAWPSLRAVPDPPTLEPLVRSRPQHRRAVLAPQQHAPRRRTRRPMPDGSAISWTPRPPIYFPARPAAVGWVLATIDRRTAAPPATHPHECEQDRDHDSGRDCGFALTGCDALRVPEAKAAGELWGRHVIGRPDRFSAAWSAVECPE